MDEDHFYVGRRILDFDALLGWDLTPLLRNQLQHAIDAHRRALDKPLLNNEDLGNLDTLYSEFANHWKRIYADMHTAAGLSRAIELLRQFLRSKLLGDYCNERYTVHQHIVQLAELNERGGKDPDALYQDCVILPLEELMLDRGYVESKMRAALLRHGEPSSDIQPLINKGDWTSLARILVNDRELAEKLFPENDHTREKVMRSIARIAEEYFLELIDPSRFTPKSQTNGSSKLSFQSDLAILPEKATPPAGQKVVSGWMNGSLVRFRKWVNRNQQDDRLDLKKDE